MYVIFCDGHDGFISLLSFIMFLSYALTIPPYCSSPHKFLHSSDKGSRQKLFLDHRNEFPKIAAVYFYQIKTQGQFTSDLNLILVRKSFIEKYFTRQISD